MLCLCVSACAQPTPFSFPVFDSLEEEILAVETNLVTEFSVAGTPNPVFSIEDRMTFHNVPGVSIAVFRDGKIAWAKGYGVLEANDPQPVTTQTLFQAGSITKPVTAMTAMSLAEAGLLSLDEPVNKYLKRWKIPENDFTRDQPLTLRHLLTHRSGIQTALPPGYPRGSAIPTVLDILRGNSGNNEEISVSITPGSRYFYSNAGYDIVAAVLEDVTGRHFEDLVAEHTLGNAGMYSSRMDREQWPPNEDLISASGHNGFSGLPYEGGSNYMAGLGAGGLWSTPTDFANLSMAVIEALQGKNASFMSKRAMQEMLKSPAIGFGVDKETDGWSFSHHGQTPGFTSRWFAYRDGRGGAVMMANGNNAHELFQEITASMSRVYGWALGSQNEIKTFELTSEQKKALVGSYVANTPDGRSLLMVITLDDGELYVESPIFHRAKLYAAQSNVVFIKLGYSAVISFTENNQPTNLRLRNSLGAVQAVFKKDQ
jgi:CubicO group peptidase (beta-lactamase class C family)